jgi:hypothetical protein
MFRGSIPSSVQRIVAEHAAQWTCRDIFVGCSGNFTIERVIAPLKRFNLHLKTPTETPATLQPGALILPAIQASHLAQAIGEQNGGEHG